MYNMHRKGAETRRDRFLRFYELYCDGLTYQQIAEKEKITLVAVFAAIHILKERNGNAEQLDKVAEEIQNQIESKKKAKEEDQIKLRKTSFFRAHPKKKKSACSFLHSERRLLRSC